MTVRLLLLLTTLTTGLISGFFYAYSCSINIGLSRLTDAEYIRAMQHINRAVLNPTFFLSFFGTLILLPMATWVIYVTAGSTSSFYCLLAACTFYFFGVFLITAMGNVPLNESLDHFNTYVATAEELNEQRIAFSNSWNRFHTIRTLANIITFVSLIWAVLKWD
ncbi:DUF1772 domain-containing protein [Olivibacter sp. SDN3]|uniref:anthrone oxygenase family protein n=1 Tax=Olivibacter sp. SDN3 TaxID=2764720 RepID=UPI001651775D|nr:anthrone oxygenase family protein [Olivibacter sp. SDN3]QNL49208.1 DUF1772 domain-containing protein [Olivibacter sp. SDN3]